MVYQSDSIWTRQERMPSVPTGSVTSSVITADTLHSSMAVTCCSRALELDKTDRPLVTHIASGKGC